MSDNSWLDEIEVPYEVDNGEVPYILYTTLSEENKKAIELHLQQDYDMRLKVADKTARVDELTELIKDAHGHGVMSPLRLAPRIKERLDTLVAELNALAAELTPQDKTGSKEVFEQD